MNLGERFITWAEQSEAVKVLAQIGSRVRAGAAAGGPDKHSDWDFQIITTDPLALETVAVLRQAGIGEPIAFVSRIGRLGTSRKVTAVFADGELDVVIIPYDQLAAARKQMGGGGVPNPMIERALADMALVLVGGYKVIKDTEGAAQMYEFITSRVSVPRIHDLEAVRIADGFVCDYIGTRRLIGRGELLAGQRWLHHNLVEANYRLLHELKTRRGLVSYPDARRLEQLDTEGWVETIAVSAELDPLSLYRAVEKSAQACRRLMEALVGDKWHWPDLARLAEFDGAGAAP
jgi:hypothetical protein